MRYVQLALFLMAQPHKILEKNILNLKNYEYGKLRAILHFQRHEPLDTGFCQRLMFFVFAFFHFLCKFIILNEMCQNDNNMIFVSRLDLGLEERIFRH